MTSRPARGRLPRAPGALLAALALAWGAACSSGETSGAGGAGGAPGGCPNDLPSGCPAGAPSYAGEVAAIVDAKCVVCHGPGGQEPQKPFGTYAEVVARKSAMLNQIYACKMPPEGGEPLTPAERQALLQWFVCGAPDN